ncbi:MAG: hypothetical protein HQL51_08760 [Magnetococcales bacterium]|nr:hypothetical protein [Magnetococcales bacterium]
MNDPGYELLLWVRGPGWILALAVFSFGMAMRLFEIFALGRREDLAPPRPAERQGSPMRTVWNRFFPVPGLFERAPATHVSGYLFHIGFFAVLFFAEFHIQLFRHLLGFGWPALSAPLADALGVVAIVALLAALVSRMRDPVKRFLSTAGDYLAWALTFLPLLTGWMAYHHVLVSYTRMVALHLLAAELLLALLPFTKLIHAVTIFVARWYTGEQFGRKGVQA